MAKPSAKKKAASGKGKQQVVDVVDALANHLVQLGARQWKVCDLEAALDKAAGSLQDEALTTQIRGNLAQAARALHARLLSLQGEQQPQRQVEAEAEEQATKAAKRAKRSKNAAAAAAAAAAAEGQQAAAEAEAEAGPPAAAPSLATAAGYRQLVAAVVESGQLDGRFSSTALLLARKLPAEELVLFHVQRLQLSEGGGSSSGGSAEALVAAARAALGVCSALACEAGSPEDALRMFGPAVGQLTKAAQVVGQQQQQQQQAEGSAAAVALLQELTQLAGRALASMQAALQQQQLRLQLPRAASDCFWRSMQQPPPAEAVQAACTVSAAACSLCTTLRLLSTPTGQALVAQGGSKQRKKLEALAAAAAADLQQLAPYAPSGQLTYLATLPQEEACSGDDAARRYLVLYRGAAKQELLGEQEYLGRLVAARKAAAAAEHLGEEALAALIAAEAASLPVSQDFVGWLQEQPPSGIVSAALAASRRGLDALSAHLVQECSDRALHALLAAMHRTGSGAGVGAAAAAGEAAGSAAEAAGAAAEGALDDLLFFADKEGDQTMFGRNWNMGSGDDDDEDDESDDGGEGRSRGLRLGSLPDDDRVSVELGNE